MPKRIKLRASLMSLALCSFLTCLLLWVVLIPSSGQGYGLILLPIAFWLARKSWQIDHFFVWVEPPVEVRLDSQASTWRLGRNNGQIISVHLKTAFIYPYFAVLKFMGIRQQYLLFLWPDSASKDHLRRLRFLCYTHLPS